MVSVADGLLYGLLPAVAGVLIGQVWTSRGREGAQAGDEAVEGILRVHRFTPVTAIVLAGAVAYLAAELDIPLAAVVLVGVVGGSTAIAQGGVSAAVAPAVRREPSLAGKSLVIVVLPETMLILALVLAMLAPELALSTMALVVAGAGLVLSLVLQTLAVRRYGRELDDEVFGRLVVAMYLAEGPALLGFVAAFFL